MKEGAYRSQIHVSARYEAIMAIDNKVHVPDAGLLKVKALILYPKPNCKENSAKKVRTIGNVQKNSNSISNNTSNRGSTLK